MLNNQKEDRSAAYKAVAHIYDESPGRSWQRLNFALSDVLTAALTAHLAFGLDTFNQIYSNFNGGYWMGNSVGSVCGEGFYSHAVKVGHSGACQSFEHYAARPPALWAEDVKTPSRLCIGSEFTWKGYKVSVTNMKSDHLIACHYDAKARSYRIGKKQIGDYDYFGEGYRKIEELKEINGGEIIVRFGKTLPRNQEPKSPNKPDKIFKITYTELAEVRLAYDRARKATLKQIGETQTPEELFELQRSITEQLNGKTIQFRHFDTEDIREAFQKREKYFILQKSENEFERIRALSESERLKEWVAGGNVPAYFRTVRLRVKGNRVETSTGQSVTLESVKATLPWALALHRKMKRQQVRTAAAMTVAGKTVDLYPVNDFSLNHVRVGCTVIPWSEVARIAKEIEGQTNAGK